MFFEILKHCENLQIQSKSHIESDCLFNFFTIACKKDKPFLKTPLLIRQFDCADYLNVKTRFRMSCFKLHLNWCTTWLFNVTAILWKLLVTLISWLNLWGCMRWEWGGCASEANEVCVQAKQAVGGSRQRPCKMEPKATVCKFELTYPPNHNLIFKSTNTSHEMSCFKLHLNWCTSWYFKVTAILWKLLKVQK